MMNGDHARVGVIGATGYAGMELIRLIYGHPQMNLAYVSAFRAREGGLQGEFAHLAHLPALPIEAYDEAQCAMRCDLVFVALPSGESGQVAVSLWKRGVRVIDLSGDLRLPNDVYTQWYGKEPVDARAQRQAVYGLPEMNANEIQGATLIANPGCYATASILSLLPLVDFESALSDTTVWIDAKSGATGAGRSAATHLQFAELSNDFYPYRVGQHQHTPEIERAVQSRFQVLLTTQLLPVMRGIFTSSYLRVHSEVELKEIYHRYVSYYAQHPFVHVRPLGELPHLKAVVGSHLCHLGVSVDKRTDTLQVFAVIDNLLKGASSQALQNANLMLGYDEYEGIPAIAPWT